MAHGRPPSRREEGRIVSSADLAQVLYGYVVCAKMLTQLP